MLLSMTKLVQSQKNIDHVAVVIDARGKPFLQNLSKDLSNLNNVYNVQVIFFDSSLEAITKRFKESRLKHPLSLSGSIKEGYNEERRILDALRQMANLTVNTSILSVHEHKSLIRNYIQRNKKGLFEVHVMSFGVKYGIPHEADIVIDVRFLKNPFFDAKLKHKNGKNKAVQDYILKDLETSVFLEKTQNYLDYLIKNYKAEGKSYIRIAFGCTGGKHRSVTVAEKFLLYYKSKKGFTARAEHRDIAEI